MRKYDLNYVVKTKKQHPCGSDLWTIIRFGADVKIKCNKCGRVVMLDLESFDKSVKKIVEEK